MNSPAFTRYETARAASYAWDEARELAKHTPAYEAISLKQEQAFTAFMQASNNLVGVPSPALCRGAEGVPLPCQSNDHWDCNQIGNL